MRTVFFGSGEIGSTVLRTLVAADLAPALVVTQPPRRRRRRGHAEPTPVHAAALAASLEVDAPPKVNTPEALERLRAARADLFLVAEYGQLLSQKLLDIPPLGTLNVHTSLLPRWRGATPIVAALLAGDEETGITIQRTVLKLDAGPVLAQRRIAIDPEDDRGTLSARLAELGGELLVEVVRRFVAGDPPEEHAQDEESVTTCRRLKRDDTVLDWTRSAVELARKVRALHPRPGARTVLAREPELPLEIVRAAPVEGEAEPGVATEGFDVGTGAGLLRVLEVVPAARKPMSAQAFLNGYRLSAGERFC